jgi:5-methylcytosine-specific restriction protein A
VSSKVSVLIRPRSAPDSLLRSAKSKELGAPTKEDFLVDIREQLREAELRGTSSHRIKSGELHRKLGGYPAADGNHQMPSCCAAMYDERKADDKIISAPPKGKGATLVIEYRVPRGSS